MRTRCPAPTRAESSSSSATARSIRSTTASTSSFTTHWRPGRVERRCAGGRTETGGGGGGAGGGALRIRAKGPRGEGMVKKLLVLSLGVVVGGCGAKSTADWIDQLHAKDSAQRLHAVKALACRPAEAEVIVPALAEALKDEDTFVRRDAAKALGEIGPPAKPALPALLLALKDKHTAVRKEAAEALRKIDPEAATRAGVR